MQCVRIIEIPKCKMVSSGLGMFGQQKFDKFNEWFSSLPRPIYPRDYLYFNGENICWLYFYDESLVVPSEFEIVDFEGGLYSVATDIDQLTDTKIMDTEVDIFLEKLGFVRDDSRFKLGHIITTDGTKETLGYYQMDYYSPIKVKLV